tara:strand:- start:5606 stop:5959 length:354 start_codon:yes stop_codon:yes gene_type:complete
MARKKKIEREVNNSPGSIENWEISTEIQINGRYVEPGTELKIKGERGRYRFMKHVVSGSGAWIDVWGGPKGSESIRSFRLERVSRVHYKNKTDQALAQEYKNKKIAMKAESSEGSED